MKRSPFMAFLKHDYPDKARILRKRLKQNRTKVAPKRGRESEK